MQLVKHLNQNLSDPEITRELLEACCNEKDERCWLDICYWLWKKEEEKQGKDLCINNAVQVR